MPVHGRAFGVVYPLKLTVLAEPQSTARHTVRERTDREFAPRQNPQERRIDIGGPLCRDPRFDATSEVAARVR